VLKGFDHMLLITSLQNPRIKQVVHLRERRERDSTNLFLIEGYRELLRAVQAGRKMESLFICPELFLGSSEPDLIQTILDSKTPVFRCSEQVFRKISYRDRPDGLIAISFQQKKSLQDLEKIISKRSSPFLLIAEAIEKPGNLGTILRSSDAVGIDGLILCDRCTDIHNPNVVRASVGTLFSVPVIEASGKDALQWLKDNNIKILASTPSAEKEFTQVDMTGPLAISLGTEQIGLSPLWMNNADLQVKIPMEGIADSLNVAMAATLLAYEAHRQRRMSVSS
jgi:RNA methyltransferase, TrmH family